MNKIMYKKKIFINNSWLYPTHFLDWQIKNCLFWAWIVCVCASFFLLSTRIRCTKVEIQSGRKECEWKNYFVYARTWFVNLGRKTWSLTKNFLGNKPPIQKVENPKIVKMYTITADDKVVVFEGQQKTFYWLAIQIYNNK